MPSFSPRRSPGIRRRFVWHQRSGSSPVRGSPVITLYGGAFGMSRAADRKRHWGRIPEGLDILVTHGPPLGILDELGPSRHDGCPELCEAVSQARPRGRVRNQQKETWGSNQGGWRGVREIVWETDQGAGWLHPEGAH